MLDGESVETKERFVGNLPSPLRTVFKIFGERVYTGCRAQIYGSEISAISSSVEFLATLVRVREREWPLHRDNRLFVSDRRLTR